MSIALPKLPMLDLGRDNLYGYTADQLRADLIKSLADNKALRERVRVLEDALREYANPLNWNEDSAGIRRVWLEPRSTTPAAYNGFEAARAALEQKP